jgi:dihydroorotase
LITHAGVELNVTRAKENPVIASNQGSAWFLANGRLVYPTHIEAGHVAIEDGRILAVGPKAERPQGAQTIDLGGLLVFPGIIDPHNHLRDFNHSHRGEIETETAAAAVGGYTTIIDMPNSDPPTISAAAFIERSRKAEAVSYVNYGLYGWAGPETIEAMPAMKDVGAVGFKVFMAESNLSTSYITRDLVNLHRILEMAARIDAKVVCHSENDSLIKHFEEKYKTTLDPDLSAYLATRPPIIEEIAVFDAIALAHWTGARLHICHVSAAESVDVIQFAKGRGRRVTCESSQAHLFLNVDDAKEMAGLAKFSPPIRTRADQERLWSGLKAGVIDMVASDHAPQTLADKVYTKDIWKVRAGSPLLDIGFALMLDAVSRGLLSYCDLARTMAERPAQVFGLFPTKGRLEAGGDADIVVVDPSAKFTVDSRKFKSKIKYSVFDGRELVGRPVMTFVLGRLVARDGEMVGHPGMGRLVRPTRETATRREVDRMAVGAQSLTC